MFNEYLLILVSKTKLGSLLINKERLFLLYNNSKITKDSKDVKISM